MTNTETRLTAHTSDLALAREALAHPEDQRYRHLLEWARIVVEGEPQNAALSNGNGAPVNRSGRGGTRISPDCTERLK